MHVRRVVGDAKREEEPEETCLGKGIYSYSSLLSFTNKQLDSAWVTHRKKRKKKNLAWLDGRRVKRSCWHQSGFNARTEGKKEGRKGGDKWRLVFCSL